MESGPFQVVRAKQEGQGYDGAYAFCENLKYTRP